MSLLVTSFSLVCPPFPVDYGHDWTHFAIVFRIIPSHKLFCYANGVLMGTQTSKGNGKNDGMKIKIVLEK